MVSGSAQSAEYVNEESGVRSIVRSGNVITDQSLRQDNITIHKHLSGTDGQKEVLYPGRQVPQPTPDELPRRGEGAMVPTAVRVDPDQPTEKLTPMSRINYGKVYTVEHNVKVKPLGTVSRDSLHALIYQFKAVWNPGLPRQRGMASMLEAGSSRVQQGASASGQGNYRAAYDSLTSQGWTPAQAEAVLKQKGKAHATSGSAGRSTSEEEQASSDENKEEAGAESHSDAQMRRAVRHLQRASGLSLEEATAVVRRERRKSLIKARAQSKDDRDDESDGEGSDSENEQQKAARNKQLAEARTRQFHNAVAALHQQGVSYEEAYRSVHASMTRGRSQTATSASQSGSTGRRRSERDDQDEEESDEESSGGGEDEDA
ncbi:hypothetical protein PRZ48_006076 [Zasmidium cellare]|uniref:DUF6590 domain-containing protein n=1 Tax=Zasmidium cellare TaxID=395010 RepID=A0ABR0ENA4_ZASCE|nr:hypothetical protein PRZ48_006076 [Zasmidium cellare]